MRGGLVTAVRTLSILKIPGRDAEEMSASLPFFPLVGALLGLGLVLVIFLFRTAGMADWPGGVAVLLVLLSGVLTRGLHLDGLADAADGLCSMTDRARTLSIMKDSRVGTFGVLALITVIGVKWVAIARLVEAERDLWLVPAFIVSRAVMADLAATLSYARAEGGTGAPFVSGGRRGHRYRAWGIALLLVAPLGPAASLSPLAGGVVARTLAAVYHRKVGGVTGDLLGASSEITEAVLLMSAALASGVDGLLAEWGALPW